VFSSRLLRVHLSVYNRTVHVRHKIEDVPDKQEVVASIRRGLAQARKGEGRPANEVFDELEREDVA
jgi:predicted transcriptional regulator